MRVAGSLTWQWDFVKGTVKIVRKLIKIGL